jgi:hypothetical protein
MASWKPGTCKLYDPNLTAIEDRVINTPDPILPVHYAKLMWLNTGSKQSIMETANLNVASYKQTNQTYNKNNDNYTKQQRNMEHVTLIECQQVYAKYHFSTNSLKQTI